MPFPAAAPVPTCWPRSRSASSACICRLTRQSAVFAQEGVDLDVSTLCDWIGAVAVATQPLSALITEHVMKAERLHADDTPVPVLAKGKTKTGRLWTVVRDDRPFAGADPPAALYFYSPDRKGEHPQGFLKSYSGLLQADAYSGFGQLYEPGRVTGAATEVACWAHARRKFFELAELKKGPIAVEAVKRMDALFAIERAINGRPPDERRAIRALQSKPLVDDLESWLQVQRGRLSPKSETAKAIDYMLRRCTSFARFLNDGRICLSNNAAERAIRAVAMRRSLCPSSSSVCKHWKLVFPESPRHGRPVARSRRSPVSCEVGGSDLVWRAGHDLLGGRMPSLISRRMR